MMTASDGSACVVRTFPHAILSVDLAYQKMHNDRPLTERAPTGDAYTMEHRPAFQEVRPLQPRQNSTGPHDDKTDEHTLRATVAPPAQENRELTVRPNPNVQRLGAESTLS